MEPRGSSRSDLKKPNALQLSAYSPGRVWVAGSLLVALAVVIAIRIRLLDMPLERDEGEYAYVGQLLLEGIPPYQNAYTMKWPGTHAAYALVMAVFGQTAGGIHAGLIVLNLATALLVFFLAKKLCGDFAAAMAAGTYALLSINPPTNGLAAHATHFVMLPALGGIVLLRNDGARNSRMRLFSAGLLFGISALMKQPGAVFGLFALTLLVRDELASKERDWNRLATGLAYLGLGGLLPLTATCLILNFAGLLDRFWLWTFAYAHSYGSSTLAEGSRLLLHKTSELFKAAPGLWAGSVLGLVMLFGEPSTRPSRFFVLGFLFFSWLAVSAGWLFRGHYFLLLLPAAGLLTGVATQGLLQFMARRQRYVQPAMFPLLLFGAAAAWSLFESRAIFFQLPPAQASRAMYGSNPFPESVEIGRYLASHSSAEARIAVIGSEPQIYFYSRRRSATGYLYMYPLTEPQPYAPAMQKEMIREIENAEPDYVVFVHIPSSWQELAYADASIIEWFTKYRQDHLRPVGVAELLPDRTEYRWSVPESFGEPRAEKWLAVYRNRKKALSANDQGSFDPLALR